MAGTVISKHHEQNFSEISFKQFPFHNLTTLYRVLWFEKTSLTKFEYLSKNVIFFSSSNQALSTNLKHPSRLELWKSVTMKVEKNNRLNFLPHCQLGFFRSSDLMWCNKKAATWKLNYFAQVKLNRESKVIFSQQKCILYKLQCQETWNMRPAPHPNHCFQCFLNPGSSEIQIITIESLKLSLVIHSICALLIARTELMEGEGRTRRNN